MGANLGSTLPLVIYLLAKFPFINFVYPSPTLVSYKILIKEHQQEDQESCFLFILFDLCSFVLKAPCNLPHLQSQFPADRVEAAKTLLALR